ncbi:MAG: TolC family protein [Thermoguttaceae bacterium]
MCARGNLFTRVVLACCIAILAGAGGVAEEPVVRVARREMIAIEPRVESPVSLPPVTIPEPASQAGTGGEPQEGVAVQSLTLADLRTIAQQSNPTLAQAQMAVRSAEGRQIQAGLYPNPEVGYSGEEMGSEGTSGMQGGFVSQEIVTAGKLGLAESVAGHGAAAARHRLEAQRWRVMNAVRAGFYEVLLAQQTVNVHTDLVRVSHEAVDITSRLRAAQEVSKAEVLQAAIEAERAEVGLFMAQNRHRTAWYQLAAVVGRPEMRPAVLDGDLIGDLPALGWDEGLGRLLAGSPELAQARARIRQARCNVALQCAERHSNFSVEAGVKYDASVDDTLADLRVAAPLRIYDRNQGNIVAAEAELIAATREVERLELELFHRFAEAFEGYANANRQVELYRSKVLGNARESLQLTETGYREGEFDYLRLLTAQRTYFSANLEYLAALRELWQRSISLDGLMLAGGLQSAE